MTEQATEPYTVSLALDPALVRDAEAEVERRNRGRADTARPYGLADLVAEALTAALGGECGCEELDAEDRAWVAAWKR